MKELMIHMMTRLLAATLLMAAAVSCAEPFSPVDPADNRQSYSLDLQISVPESGLIATKAETISPEAAEAAAHELQIWAFKNGDNGSAVAYIHIPSTSLPQSGIYDATLTIPRTVIASGVQKLDFLIVANGSSIGGVHKTEGEDDVTGTMTRTEVMALTFGKTNSGQTETNYFGSATESQTVSTFGLPMSCLDNTGFDISFLQYGLTTLQIAAIKEKAMTESTKDEPYNLSDFDNDADKKLSDTQKAFIQTTLCPRQTGMTSYPSWSTLWSKLCPSFVLTRAVSKIRFVFTKANNMTESTEIVSAEIFSEETDQGAIPSSTYIFPRDPIAFPDNTSYDKVTWGSSESPLLANDAIGKIDTPYRLLWKSGMTAQDYTTLLNTARNNGEVTEKLLYLRESDRALRCKVAYKIGNKAYETTFSLPDGANFHRNNWWTIYAFFMSYKLNFVISVHNWDTYGSGAISIGNSV